MAVLFLANFKPQIFCFTFNIPGAGKGATWQLNLHPYTQQRIYKDTNVDLLKELLSQVHHYGFQTYEEALLNPKYDGYGFSFGKPFSDDEIIELKAQYFRCSQKIGAKRRNQSLLETGNHLLNAALNMDNKINMDDMYSDPKNFGLKVVQQGDQYERGRLNENYGLL
ncbi:hypothetical protein [Commensalibacter nepenthis]|uniref:Uncharacterized protein n=1 Tax=Commensalibacter nepenthis TaxID=3043872 RepID=A0ABT6Q839_9PROT|nr:hypothetical protein [Commensalibacter sp. TBRC 10068]MDI2113065.1 hypothetical protein [Commensalibacter sp. TBRC 10068]